MRSRKEILEEQTYPSTATGQPIYNPSNLQIGLLTEVLLDIRDTLHNRKKSEPQNVTGV